MEAILFIGIQATGKSTFYSQHFVNTHIRINLDMLKTRHREKRLFETCLEIKQPFVIDNTSPTVEDRKRYIEPAQKFGFQIIGYYFESKIADALNRDRDRPLAQQIPEKGIRATHAKLVLPSYAEGFEKLYCVRLLPEGFVVGEWSE